MPTEKENVTREKWEDHQESESQYNSEEEDKYSSEEEDECSPEDKYTPKALLSSIGKSTTLRSFLGLLNTSLP